MIPDHRYVCIHTHPVELATTYADAYNATLAEFEELRAAGTLTRRQTAGYSERPPD